MKSFSNNPAIERAQPWLGTLVSIRVEGLPASRAHRAINAAFAEVAAVHRLMSFHQQDSDVSRLNRHAVHEPVTVHPHTFEVLQWALRFSSCSNGCFDISVGAELVDWQFLPRPSDRTCDPRGSWRDIELRSDGHVVFHRPLWIDLGGIAKGYAVDRASEILRSSGAQHSVVNAGGDIRVNGKQAERIALDIGSPTNALSVLELSDGSVASSTGRRRRRWHHGRLHGPHVHGVLRSPAPTERFVCVVAERCVVADALTKVVIAEGVNGANLLRRFGASAHLHDPVRVDGNTSNQKGSFMSGSIRKPDSLGRSTRLSLYVVSLGVWISGGLWLLFHNFLVKRGEFGPEVNPLEPWFLKVHGAFAVRGHMDVRCDVERARDKAVALLVAPLVWWLNGRRCGVAYP